MARFEVLGTGETVDPTEPVDAGKTLVYLLVGASFLFMILNVGRSGGQWLTGMFSNITGVGAGDNSGVTESIGGGF